jgi:ABC-type polysaccharide/polyol phosphate export permease
MVRDLKAQYKQSLLGYAWIVVNPIAQLATFSFIFTTALRPETPAGVPFPLFLSLGLLPWIFFANSLSLATMSIVTGRNVVSSVYFPRELLVIAAVLVRCVDLACGIIIVGVLMVVSGQPLALTAVWLPFLLMIHVMFVIGLALPLAALNLFFHDVRYLVLTALHLWFFLTPILYSVSAVPDRYRILYDLNPNARLIQTYRWAMFQGVGPPIESVLWAVGLTTISVLIGYYLFKKMEPYFADYI